MEASQTPQQPQAPAPPVSADDVRAAQAQSAENPQSTDDLLRQIIATQEHHREEVAALRQQIDEQKQPQFQQAPATNLSPEEALQARMAEVAQHDFYCPGCGLLYDYQQRCTGRAESPHAPIEVVSTDELKAGDESKYSKPEYVKL